VESLVGSFPDRKPTVDFTNELRLKSQIIPIAVETVQARYPTKISPPKIKVAWNHRWEFDKGPDDLMEVIKGTNDDFEFHLFGERFRRQPEAFKWIVNQSQVVVHHDEERASYLKNLARCHVVLSTSKHEFQGLAVLDGIQQGLIPIVPDALSYVEMYPKQYRYPTFPSLVANLNHIKNNWTQLYSEFRPIQTELLSRFSASTIRDHWDNIL
jgi:glycosyltransferase involved in cell wall biosynthesis